MTDNDVYEIEAPMMLRLLQLLAALNEIKESLPADVVGLMECFDDEVKH